MSTTHHRIAVRRRRRARVLAALAVLAALLPITSVPAAETAKEDFVVVGEWRPEPPSGITMSEHMGAANLFSDPVARRLFFYNGNWLQAYDLDTLRPLGEGIAATGVHTATYVDPFSGLVLIAFVDLSGVVRLDAYGLEPAGMVRRASRTLAELQGRPVVGMHTTSGSDLLWLLTVSRPTIGVQVPHTTVVAELDLGALVGGGQVPTWTHPVPQCAAPVAHLNRGFSPAAMVQRNDHLYFGCAETSAAPLAPASPRGVGRLTLEGSVHEKRTAPGAFRFFGRDGSYEGETSYSDRASGRLALVSTPDFTSVHVFDTQEEAYVGALAAGDGALAGGAVDPLTGRLYALSGQIGVGLIATDLRATPVRQGVKAPSFRTRGSAAASDAVLLSDSANSRLFIKYNDVYVIVEDRFAPFIAPEQGAVDANTTGGPEVPGVTRATFSGTAFGYGSRYRQAGGIGGLANTYLHIGAIGYPVGEGTRDYRFALLHRLTVANDEATAAATGGAIDTANTADDLGATQPRDTDGNPVARPGGSPDNPEPVGPLVQWPYDAASCSDFGNGSSVQDVRGARVSCSAREPAAGSHAIQDRSELDGVVVARSETRADSGVDARRGTFTVMTASAQGIDVLGGLLRIGEVRVRAEASAHGVPGTTLTSYKRTVEEVTLDGRVLCGDGSDRPCNLKSIEDTVNTHLVGRARIRFPEPMQSRSPGGYQALVQRSPADHGEEMLLNGQPSDRPDVPGVVITVFHDRYAAGRTIIDLAAVEAEARYGITEGDSTDLGFAGSSSGINASDLASADGGAPVFGLDPAMVGRGAPGSAARGSRGLASLPELLGRARLALNGLGLVGRLLPAWLALVVPIYLSARRWMLLQRATILHGGRS